MADKMRRRRYRTKVKQKRTNLFTSFCWTEWLVRPFFSLSLVPFHALLRKLAVPEKVVFAPCQTVSCLGLLWYLLRLWRETPVGLFHPLVKSRYSILKACHPVKMIHAAGAALSLSLELHMNYEIEAERNGELGPPKVALLQFTSLAV